MTDLGLISIVVSTPHSGCGNPSSILGSDTMSRIETQEWGLEPHEAGEDIHGQAGEGI